MQPLSRSEARLKVSAGWNRLLIRAGLRVCFDEEATPNVPARRIKPAFLLRNFSENRLSK
mgnify:CR=1 FL=1